MNPFKLDDKAQNKLVNALIIIAVCLGLLFLSLAYRTLFGSGEVKFKFQGITIESSKDDLVDNIKKSNEQVKSLDSILKTSNLPPDLKDSIENMRHERQLDIFKAEKLLSEFSSVSQLDEKCKEELIIKVIDYLSTKTNSDSNNNSVSIARNLISNYDQVKLKNNTITDLKHDKDNLTDENNKLKNEIIIWN